MYEPYNLKTLVYTSLVPLAPVIVVVVVVVVVVALIFILIFFLTTTIDQYLLTQLPSASNNIILAPKSFNLKADKLKVINKFKLLGRQYVQCKALTKTPKNTKQRSSYI